MNRKNYVKIILHRKWLFNQIQTFISDSIWYLDGVFFLISKIHMKIG